MCKVTFLNVDGFIISAIFASRELAEAAIEEKLEEGEILAVNVVTLH